MPPLGLNTTLIKGLIDITHPRLRLFGVTMTLLSISSVLEGISISLVIPLLQVMVKRGDYRSAIQIPFFDSIQNLLPENRLRYIFMAFILMILVAVVLKNACLYASELILSSVSRNSEHAMRTKIFERYLGFSKIFFDQNKIGNLADLATNQTNTACNLFIYLHCLAQYALASIVYVTILLFISWKLLLISLVILPVIHFAMSLLSKKILASTEAKFEADQQMSSHLYECLSNISLVRSSVGEKTEFEAFKKLSDTGRRTLYSIWKKIYFAPHLQEVALTAAIALLCSISVFVFLKGEMIDIALFLSFFLILKRFTMSISVMNNALLDISRSYVPLAQILDILKDDPARAIVSGKKPFPGLRERLEFKNVAFGYRGSSLLSGIDFTVDKGKMTALIGPTGAGKTSLINLIPRFYDVTAGQVTLDGCDIRDFELDSYRRKVAIVEQDPSILNRTIRQNIVYGFADCSQEALDEASKKAYIYDFIMSLPAGYDTFVGDRGVRLSGGEKQRIALARAFLKDPDIFIFDEATSSLDVETEKLVQDAMNNLMKGRTIVAIAHRLFTVRKADVILVVEKGGITERGTFNELIEQKGRFHHYWNLQMFA